MSEFKPITSQEQLDAVLKDRLRRERKRILKLLVRLVLDLQDVISDINDKIEH